MDAASIASGLTAYASPLSSELDEVALHYALSLPVTTPQGESVPINTILPATSKSILVLGRNLL